MPRSKTCLEAIMQIHIGRNNQPLGAFTVPQVLNGLAGGQFLPTDIAWHEGLDDWMPLSALTVLSEAPKPEPAKSTAPAPAKPEFSLPKIERKETPPPKWKAWLVRAVVFVVLLAVAIPAARFVKQRMITSRAISSAVSVVDACNRYADQHGGSYPPDLKTLVTEKLVPDEAALGNPLGGDEPGIGWQYYGAGVMKTGAPDKVIVISRTANEAGERVIGTSDGRAKLHMMPLLPQAK